MVPRISAFSQQMEVLIMAQLLTAPPWQWYPCLPLKQAMTEQKAGGVHLGYRRLGVLQFEVNHWSDYKTKSPSHLACFVGQIWSAD